MPTAPIEKIRNTIINSIKDDTHIPYNATFAFEKKARELKLGAPLTDEHDIDGYRARGFANGILYARIDAWDKIVLLVY